MATKTEIKDRLLHLYERALLSSTYEYLHGEECRDECEAAEDSSACYEECAANCQETDAALKQEFIGLLGMLETA